MIKHKKYLLALIILGALVAIPFSRANAATTITVNSIADDSDNDGECTLREAITAANTDAVSGAAANECAAGSGAGDIIEFDIAGAGPHTIQPTAALPQITSQIIINGYSETGAVENTNVAPAALNGTLMIEVDGQNIGGGSAAFDFRTGSDGSELRGIVVNRFTGSAMEASGFGTAQNITVAGNYFGTNVAGTADLGNGSRGIGLFAAGAADITIGGTAPADRNLISGNNDGGIGVGNSTPLENLTIQGNIIGLNAAGTAAIANTGFGVAFFNDVINSSLGGTASGAGNIISGNTGGTGFLINDAGVTGITIAGNYIGVGANGTTALANSVGISISGGSDSNTVGGTTSAAANVISGNGSVGMTITGGSNLNTVSGNIIGLAANGSTDVGNGSSGVNVSVGASSNTIGGDVSGERNIISGNGGAGVEIVDDTTDNNVVTGNYIGTNAAGTTDAGNDSHGVSLAIAVSGTIVGGDTAGERNVISGNGGDGVKLNLDVIDSVITGNYVGVGANGTTALGNADNGVSIVNDSFSTIVGGTTAGLANTIANNSGNGVIVEGSGSLNNAILRNSIHHNAAPSIDLANNGTTANDAGDGDSGANDLLNFPVFTSVTVNGSNTDVAYTLDVPAGGYRVEFFSNNGRTFIDSQDITHTGSGSESFSKTLTGNDHTALRMTATEIDGVQTSGFGPTSEFSDLYSTGTATMTVNSTADDEDDDGDCTLREAITASNDDAESGVTTGECAAGAAVDTIEFDIAGAGPHTIQPGSALPSITSPDTTINGYSETGAVENSGDYSACFVGTIMIEIDGTNVVGGPGLNVTANDVTIRGLAINRFDGDGITVSTVAGAIISGNILGLDDEGLVDLGNGDAGVSVNSTGDSMIGGTTAADRNLISGNEGFGGVNIYADAGTTSVSGNCIGTDATGDTALPNNHSGVNIYQAGANIVIGGDTTQERNIISGNDENGIAADESSIGSITGNYIGTNVDGAADLGNGMVGIYIDGDASVSYIGGLTSGERNVISGNESHGIQLEDGAEDARIRGNYVGVGANGLTDLGNTGAGILVNSDNNIIGGTATGARNIVSGNTNAGISLNASDGNTVQGNYVGLDSTGLVSVTNCNLINTAGIAVSGSNNTVGGSTASARNIVGLCGYNIGRGGTGIQILGGFGSPLGGNTFQGNYIGTNKNGETLGSTIGVGIGIVAQATENLIGGTAPGEGNLVRGMGGGIASIELTPFSPTDNTIIGNKVYENSGGNFTNLGIDLLSSPDFGTSLVEDGVTANDAGDADTGPNDYLNFPSLDSSSASTGSLDVQFDLDVPNVNAGVTGYRVEFFANDAGDTSGNGEGQIYLGYANVAGDVTNNTETITLDPGVIDTGTYDITATVTEIDGSTNGFSATSEFSAFLNNQTITAPLDNDGDGVNDAVEDAGPNGGDGNNDGTQDSDQTGVASILDSTGDNYLTLALDPDGTCTAIDDFAATAETDQADADPDYDYTMGLNTFTIPCAGSVDGTIYYHGYENLDNYTHRKFGPTTPGDTGTNAWYDSDFTYGTTTVGSDTVATASFSLTDGSLGDDTGNDDLITDDNGPGLATTTGQPNTGSILEDLANTGKNIQNYAVLGAIMLIIGSSIITKTKQHRQNT